RRRHTRLQGDWSSDVCSSDLNRELRTIGANLVVTPQEDSLDVEIGGVNLKPPSDGAFLNEADLHKIKGIFWHNNITGFAPMLPRSEERRVGKECRSSARASRD